jgi:hypothetical protein
MKEKRRIRIKKELMGGREEKVGKKKKRKQCKRGSKGN